MTEYVTLEQAAEAFAVQTVLSTSDCLDMLYYAIQKEWISPSDVAPVRHGRWIGAPLFGNDNCKCSECGSWHNIHANLRGKIMQKYCPNCGAKMDGGAN